MKRSSVSIGFAWASSTAARPCIPHVAQPQAAQVKSMDLCAIRPAPTCGAICNALSTSREKRLSALVIAELAARIVIQRLLGRRMSSSPASVASAPMSHACPPPQTSLSPAPMPPRTSSSLAKSASRLGTVRRPQLARRLSATGLATCRRARLTRRQSASRLATVRRASTTRRHSASRLATVRRALVTHR